MNSLAQTGRWERFLWPGLASALLIALWHYSVIWTATRVFSSLLDVEKTLIELSIFRRAGRNFGLTPLQLLATVVCPAALPRMLGYLVIDSRNAGNAMIWLLWRFC